MLNIGLERILIEGRVWLDGYLRLEEQPVEITGKNVAADSIHLFAKDNGGGISRLFYKDDGQVEHEVVTSGSGGGGVTDHGALTGLADDDHAQYLLTADATSRALFAANWLDLTDLGATTLHSHAWVTDHGALTGLSDDDHTQYLLASAATDRATFAANWTDLTDTGATTLHSHSGGLTGSGSAGRVAFWDGAASLSSDADFTYASNKLLLTGGVARADFNAALEIQGTGGEPYSSMVFGGQSTSSYGGLIWTSDTTGNVATAVGCYFLAVPSSSTNSNFRIYTNDNIGGAGPTLKLSVLGNGNLGIGVTTPLAKVHSSGSIRLNDDFQVEWGGDQNGIFGSNASDYLCFLTNNAASMTVNSAGNVLIGGFTAFPSSGTKGLVFADGTALSSLASNTAGLYADDVGGTVNMFAINEAGTVTQLTGGFNGTVTPVTSITVVNGFVTAVS